MRGHQQIAAVAALWLLVVAAGQAASVTIPAGTTLTVRITDSLDSDRNYPGEMFRATVDAPITLGGRVVVPQGAEAIGRVTAIEQAGRFQGRSMVAMELTALNFEGKSVGILTSAYQETGTSRGRQAALLAGGGGGIGSLLGAVAGGKKGFFLGAGLGALAGAMVHSFRGRAPIRVPAESLVLFTLQTPLTVDPDY